MSNFQFLESHWTDLAKLGDLSEKYVYSDPNTSIIKQGMLSEVMVKYIAEWPTDSNTGNNGYADYALFIGEKLVGIVEAKKKHTNISSVLDGQCKDYAKMIKSEHQKYVINRFGAYMVPFLYATNGRPYIKQYEQMSGIWCLDVREPFNAPKALSGSCF